MNATILARNALVATVAALFLGVGPLVSSARAQGDTIRCESQNNNYRECQYFSDGAVRLMRQLSESPCDQGRSWGYDSGRRILWVAQGCRGDFLVEFDRGGRFGGRDDGSPPQITTLRNGGIEAMFGGGCIVSYDNTGRRTYSRPGCSSDEIRRADNAVRSQADNNFDNFDRQPEINIGRNGDGEVFFRNNNCVVYYNSRGGRSSSRPGCSGSQLRQADQAMADYRREQRLGGGFGGGEFESPPQILMANNGYGRVVFSSNNCNVYYDNRGRRQSSSNSCGGSQVRRADEAMSDYRRGQGLF